MPTYSLIFKDVQASTICYKTTLGHHLEAHMWLIDRLNGYMHIRLWETWWIAAGKGLFEWKPSNVRRLTRLIRRSCSVLPKPIGSEYIMLCHLLRKADEMTGMVYATI